MSISMFESLLVTPEQLNDALLDPQKNVVPIFTSMSSPGSNNDIVIPEEVITGSLFFDFEHTFADPDFPGMQMMPDELHFTAAAQTMGLNHDTTYVVYDDKGIFSAPRVYKMLEASGHKQVHVLDGGLPAWIAKSFPMQKGLSVASTTGDFVAQAQTVFINKVEMLTIIAQQSHHIIDARSPERFYARTPEPRLNMRGGHMPGAKNLPYSECLDGGFYKSLSQLDRLFSKLDIKSSDPIVFTCGSGVTACLLSVAAQVSGFKNICIYNGSWSEWASGSDTPIVTN